MDLWVHGTAQEFAKFVQLAGSFLSRYIGDFWDRFFTFTLSVTHAIAAILLFLNYFPLRFSMGLMILSSLIWDY